ncbi:LLM class flavin-dependent oxidoreductase [Corticimicrobacter populi]|uniref:LLM class flavin-dependent oxidoreductase n=1 Tax=Corticimicrobacter populi TaxID=2175229 RepID=A0A2V1K2K0_9BURK|nr:LLM class flavin-dependent oxidoreductase [Corticimicrobacter populi]PWF22513.1 LLM class flavin-dependent oxidoreductase [Corticimicrobacter populi]
MARHETLQFGLDTFGDVTRADDGSPHSHAQVLRCVVEQAVLADQLGIDAIGIGEHHRPDFAVSSPDVVLGAIAGATRRITLGSAVTVLSSDDPIRVVERFSTLDAVSSGRAEVQLGRGSFIESFHLFGQRLDDYEMLFEEKLALYMAARSQQPVTWSGRHRESLSGAMVYPPTENRLLPTWVGVGGTPQSLIRAARYGLPVVLAIIGGDPLRFRPLRDLYAQALRDAGQSPLPVAAHLPGFIANTDAEALEQSWPYIGPYFSQVALERGGRALSRQEFLAQSSFEGAYLIGSPETVARKIVRIVRGLDLARLDFKYANGAIPHALLMRSIELYGSKVIPLVRELLQDAGNA